MIRFEILLFFILLKIIASVNGGAKYCGYDNCPKPEPDMLNIHIIAHTHDDVGWLKTIDQYYYGTKNIIQFASVQYILNSVVGELLQDPSRRFIYVESAFFFKWWDEQSDSMKRIVKKLVDEGRLEFIGGAWSMNDEATTHYQSTIDQFTWGLRRLNDTFGECGRPKIGWQIDPFGHSREMASLLAQMNFDGLFLGRIDYQDKEKRLANQNAEMIWHGSDNLGENADLFTGILFNGYDPPPGLCFDTRCYKEPLVDDENSPEYNLNEKMNAFYSFVEKMKTKYRTNNLLITMGGDFHYQAAQDWYINLDRLMKHVNGLQSNGSTINMFYSTPSCYLKSLHDSNATWPTKNDDFFPYGSGPHTYWTGYFTSRPSLKLFERNGNGFLQVCKQLSALAPTRDQTFEENLSNLREAMGVMQHHDAVSGTEKHHVAKDYARLLQIGIDRCSENIRDTLNQFTTKSEAEPLYANHHFDFKTCSHLNISACDVSENSERFLVTLYNPLAHRTVQHVRIPIPDGEYEVLNYGNYVEPSQIVPIPEEIQKLFYRESKAVNELVFEAKGLPALGFKSYYVQRKPHTIEDKKRNQKKMIRIIPVTIGDEYFNATFEDGLLTSIFNEGVELELKQNFYSYKATKGDRSKDDDKRASGAYVFRPNVTEAEEIVPRADIEVIRGKLVDEVHQTFNSWISQVVRIYKDKRYIELEWMVGDIPINDGEGREIITRFDTDIESNEVFYTDSNGREMLERQRNHRDTWKLNLTEQISSNYYPVTTKIAIEDNRRRMAILNDRAQGGSSLSDGSIELMIHRRLLYDDKLEVNEILNEVAFGKGLIVRGKSYLVFNSKKQNDSWQLEAERFLQLEKHLPSIPFFSSLRDMTFETWNAQFNGISHGLLKPLPKNVHLLTFEPWKTDSILIRFEHIFALNESRLYSQNVTFDLKDVFSSTFDIFEIRETTLAGNQWLNEAKRFKFTAENSNIVSPTSRFTAPVASELNLQSVNGSKITLKPMEIRTFVLRMKFKPNQQTDRIA